MKLKLHNLWDFFEVFLRCDDCGKYSQEIKWVWKSEEQVQRESKQMHEIQSKEKDDPRMNQGRMIKRRERWREKAPNFRCHY